jgi:SAM-dependent methyltransferase
MSQRRSRDRYLFPRHPTEIDRLDVQHYALRMALGADYLAPLSRVGRVLDVGAGNGQWGYDLCAKFPRAMVAGVDLVSGKPGQPPGYRFVRANLLYGLPFVDDAFDFVHQRLLASSSIPVTVWPALIGDLVRVTRPGGWVELVEVGPWLEPAGPATTRLFELSYRLGRLLGLDMLGEVFRTLDDQLRSVGLLDVERQEVSVPVGEWGGVVGSKMAANVRALFTRLGGQFETRLGVPSVEFAELLQAMQDEQERFRSSAPFAVGFGRKAGGPADRDHSPFRGSPNRSRGRGQ